MTFGQTLKQLLNISGMKSAHLAAVLGYDTSYISRWVNDIKLPSLRGNEDLFGKLAGAVISSCDDAALDRLSAAYGVEHAWLEEAVVSSLKTSYESALSPAQRMPTNPNAVFVNEGEAADMSSFFTAATQRALAESRRGMVEYFTTAPLEIYANKNMRFWDTILSAAGVDEEAGIVVHQLIDMNTFEKNVDTYCATICTLARFHRRMHYEFYSAANVPSNGCGFTTAIENSLLCHVLYSKLSPSPGQIFCTDRDILRHFISSARTTLQDCPKIMRYSEKAELEESPFLYDFVMSGSLRYLLRVMHPIYMDDDFAASIAARYLPELTSDDFQMYYNSLCSNTEREVILYRTALLEYIYSGNIYLFGREMQLDRQERAEHLKQLLDNIRSGACTLKILDDENPLLSRRDTQLSVYLSRSTGFMAASENGWYSSFKFCSHQMVELFNTFFTHLWQLGSEYMLSGSDAEDFIRRGLTIM